MKKIAAAAAVLALLCAAVFFCAESVDDHFSESGRVGSAGSVSVLVSCEEIAKNDSVGQTLRENGLIPSDGVIVIEENYPLEEGDTAFSVLRSVLLDEKIHFDYTSISDRSAYVRGIGNIYEYDCGDLSGWMYSVNGDFPTVSSSEYELHDGDELRWLYTCDLGRDVGDTYYTRGEGAQHEE